MGWLCQALTCPLGCVTGRGGSEICFGNGFLFLVMFSALLKAWQGEGKDIPDVRGGSAVCWQ